MMTPPRRHLLPLALVAGLLAGCGGDDPATPPPPPTLTITGGAGQTGEAGSQLPQPITAQLTDRKGPVAGAAVAFSVETGGGLVSRTQATTDATGTATVVWTLGGTLGEQRLSVSASGSTQSVTATATPGPPEIAAPVAGNGQFALVARPVPVRPRVQVTDRFGNPIAGVAVVFTVLPGSGSIADSTGVTDSGGFVTLGQWTLGPTPGFNRLRALAAQAVGEFIAIGTPASVTAVDGQGQTVNAGTRAPVSPAVVAFDGDGQPLPGVTVTFVVTGGGGLAQSATQVTDAQGIARVGGWILGQSPGANTLEARSTGVPAAAFVATGVAATPAVSTVVGPQAWDGFLGNYLSGAPAVRVTDGKGDPVAGVAVTWQADGGGTLVQRGPAATDFDGQAALSGWRLGGTASAQSVRASVAGLADLTFTATAAPLPAPAFRIEVRFTGNPPSDAQRAAFDQAATRWSQLILGDVEDVLVELPGSGTCYPSLNETIDDVVIFAEIVAIDGAGGVLGQAGPCLIRSEGFLTVVGRMRFDIADVAALETSGRLNDVILHEMGHVLGVGSLWGLQGLLQNAGSGDPWFSGPTGRAAFLGATGPAGYSGNVVPVENTGGAGTRDGHWRESVATNELMTGFLNTGSNPLSAITVTSLRDQGYLVNDAAADQFSLAAFLRSLGAPPLQLQEAPLAGPVLVVNRRGGVVRAVPRL